VFAVTVPRASGRGHQLEHYHSRHALGTKRYPQKMR
jgi:hypothetical protein